MSIELVMKAPSWLNDAPRAVLSVRIALTASVGGVVVLGHPGHGERTPPAWEWVIVVATAIGVVVGAFALASRRRASAKALIFGIACGAMFGYQAVFSKVAVDDFVAGGLTGLITSWQLWAMLVAATAGTLVQQYAFAAGNLATSLPASKIVEPIVAFSLGIAVLVIAGYLPQLLRLAKRLLRR